MFKKKIGATLCTAIAFLSSGSNAVADLRIDLRFDPNLVLSHRDQIGTDSNGDIIYGPVITDADNPGSLANFDSGLRGYKSASLKTLTPIGVNIYVDVTGISSSNDAREGLQSAIMAFKSQVIAAGCNGSITRVVFAPTWRGPGSAIGQPSNLSDDGVGDWGSDSAASFVLADGPHFRVRATNLTSGGALINFGGSTDAFGAAGSINSEIPLNQGYEHLVGYFVFTPTSLGGFYGHTTFSPVVPSTGGNVFTAVWWEDSTNPTASQPTGIRNSTANIYGPITVDPFYGTAVDAGVSFFAIPEPTSISGLGFATTLLLRRRQPRS